MKEFDLQTGCKEQDRVGCGWEGWLTADRSPAQAGRPAGGPAVGGDSKITARHAGRYAVDLLQPSGIKVSIYDNVKPSKTGATASET